MRLAALTLVVALIATLAPAVAPTPSCCCILKAGATCPMKHAAVNCGGASCGLSSGEPHIVLSEQPPAVLHATVAWQIPDVTTTFARLSQRAAGRILQAPELPPPKRA